MVNPISQHELDAPPWLRVESTLMDAARTIRAAYDGALSQLELNLTTASTLAYVVENGPLTQTALAERLGIGRAAAGTNVDKLEERGLLRREADKEDRRVWLVHPTADGAALAERINDVDRAVRQQLRKGIDRQERQQLASLLIRLQKNLADGVVCPTDPPEEQRTQEQQTQEHKNRNNSLNEGNSK